MRNDPFSGARAPFLGSHLAVCSCARDLAFTEIDNHSLHHHDVDKLDNQDDNVATRLLSGAVLTFVQKRHPDRVGFTVYLLRLWRRFLLAGN